MMGLVAFGGTFVDDSSGSLWDYYGVQGGRQKHSIGVDMIPRFVN